MKKSWFLVVSLLVVMSMVLAACQTATTEAPVTTEAPAAATEAPAAATAAPAVPTEAPAQSTMATSTAYASANPGLQMDSAKVATQFFNDKDYELSLKLMGQPALNPTAPIYLQYLVNDPTDISKYPQYAEFAKKAPPYNICFSNASRIVAMSFCEPRSW